MIVEKLMKRILFIGNSHTYMNDMPELVRLMMENVTGEDCEVFMLAYSNRSLKWHMDDEYFSERFNILRGGFDYCVMQEQAHPLTSMEDTEKYTGRIIEMCRKAGTVPIIFETWAEKAKPENQAEMNRRYRKITSEQNILLAPVGEVWENVRAAFEELDGADLYYRDGAHASATGDFLAAMVLVKTITGKLPDEDFKMSFDFTLPGDEWQPVNEDVTDEPVQLPEDEVKAIRKFVDLC